MLRLETMMSLLRLLLAVRSQDAVTGPFGLLKTATGIHAGASASAAEASTQPKPVEIVLRAFLELEVGFLKFFLISNCSQNRIAEPGGKTDLLYAL